MIRVVQLLFIYVFNRFITGTLTKRVKRTKARLINTKHRTEILLKSSQKLQRAKNKKKK